MDSAFDWHSFLLPFWLSLKVSLIASILTLIAGIWIASWMAERHFSCKAVLETIFMLPLVLPPTVVGFLLLTLLGRKSWIGRLMEWLFAQPVIFTWYAAVIAAIVISFPLVYQTVKVGIASVSVEYKDAARLDGANERQVLGRITLPLAGRSLLTAYTLGFARALGEFGATLMIAGNIPGRTQTIPTVIYTAVETNQMHLAWIWTFIVIMISFILLSFTGTNKASG
ncbi:Molybdenum transport system permease protein ModB [Paenibacillus sp. CECT 9249]|uniref:molybdate ABC transporter permease subunit n=1 Tax=Paenibacillus sp. CECT 9249 TaxID=2845385 RepID=UPI001E3543ED|nr:molybdate ABC transporter permease subunit [Paenibacillus sp. CECT 9249]CAH0121117.1 Molybdenum transport system permease protein ModB [Paenibacillus sp. CECT 9249]